MSDKWSPREWWRGRAGGREGGREGRREGGRMRTVPEEEGGNLVDAILTGGQGMLLLLLLSKPPNQDPLVIWRGKKGGQVHEYDEIEWTASTILPPSLPPSFPPSLLPSVLTCKVCTRPPQTPPPLPSFPPSLSALSLLAHHSARHPTWKQ